MLKTVGLSQVIQIPISLLATAGNLRYGEVDVALALGIAILLMGGVLLGARVAHVVPAPMLKRFVAAALLLVGGLMSVGLVARLL